MEGAIALALRSWCRLEPKPAPGALALDEEDWYVLARMARAEGVAGLVHRALDLDPAGTLAPQEVQNSLRTVALGQAAAHAREEAVLAEVLDAMATAEVRPVLMRGLGLVATVYRDGSLRPQVDHDLLVSPEELGPAREALLAAGFRLSPGSHGPFLRGPSVVDLHLDPWGADRIPSRSRTSAPDSAGVRHRATVARVAGHEVAVPAPEDRILLLASHAVKHSFDRLIRLVDLAEVWRAGGFDPERLAERSLRDGRSDSLYYALVATRERLGADIPADIVERLRPRRRFFVDRGLSRYLEGGRADHFAEWLLLYQVPGAVSKLRALGEMFWTREEIDRILAAGPVHAAAAIPWRLTRLAGRAAASTAVALVRPRLDMRYAGITPPASGRKPH